MQSVYLYCMNWFSRVWDNTIYDLNNQILIIDAGIQCYYSLLRNKTSDIINSFVETDTDYF